MTIFSFLSVSEWRNFVRIYSKRWKDMTLYWLTQFNKPVHIVVYEDMIKYTMKKMLDLVKFLEITVDFRSLYCVSGDSVANMRRLTPNWMSNITLFDIYAQQSIVMVNSYIKEVSVVTKLKFVLKYMLITKTAAL